MSAYLDYVRSDGHLLPAEGSMGRQSHQFVRALRLADAERARIDDERRQQEEASRALDRAKGAGRG